MCGQCCWCITCCTDLVIVCNMLFSLGMQTAHPHDWKQGPVVIQCDAGVSKSAWDGPDCTCLRIGAGARAPVLV